MAAEITDYEPKLVWKYFKEISQIPRCSKHEKAVGDYIESVAKRLGLDYSRDSIGNIVIRKPATPGYENAIPVVLQSHMDMVCEKDSEVKHDFLNDPIQLEIDGEWLTAKGTTLGADNGVGVAAGLAVLEDNSMVHGPLEVLITVDEETGMTGASALSEDALKGKVFINLDSEEEDTVYIGCAGGGDTHLTLPIERICPPGDTIALRIKVSGLKGGHSGVDIHEGRANAIKVLTRMLREGMRSVNGIMLAELKGGNKRNAIPREAEAVVVVSKKEAEVFHISVKTEGENVSSEYNAIEPDFRITIENTDVPSDAAGLSSSSKILSVLTSMPHGVLSMSKDIPNLVETSTNLAIVNLGEKELNVEVSSRSSIKSALNWAKDIHRAVAELSGALIEEPEGYPGWTPDLNSHVLEVVSEVHEKLFGKPPEKKAIHAGLECGLFKEKFPWMDMVSFGPQIEHPHSPSERVKISSVEKFWKLIRETLRALAEEEKA